jgi:circadian clock protein KaiC
MPVSAMTLTHVASRERISSGIPKLDKMLGDKGYYRGSSILVSGTAGTGKTSIAASFAESASSRGDKTLYFCFEESQNQLFRNMESIGLDLSKWQKKGKLKVVATRPSYYGLEMHLVHMHKAIESFKPTCVIIDPISNMISVGSIAEVRTMMTRLIDSLKSAGITTIFTSLNGSNHVINDSEVGISSLIDTWISVREVDAVGERNRALYILKSRGMAHSNQVREYLLTSHGIDLVEVYTGPNGVLTGSARQAQEAYERAQAEIANQRRAGPYSQISAIAPSKVSQ